MPRKVGERLHSELRDTIELLAAVGWPAPKIERVLGAAPGFRDEMPDTRTIQRYVQRVRQGSGPDEPWTRTEMAGDDAILVLDVLTTLVLRIGSPRSITRAQARWLLWVRQAAPDLDPLAAWQVALLYLARERSSAPDYADLDAVLALAPWRSEQARSTYLEALGEKRIPASRGFNVVEDQHWRDFGKGSMGYYVDVGGRRMTVLDLVELGEEAAPGEKLIAEALGPQRADSDMAEGDFTIEEFREES